VAMIRTEEDAFLFLPRRDFPSPSFPKSSIGNPEVFTEGSFSPSGFLTNIACFLSLLPSEGDCGRLCRILVDLLSRSCVSFGVRENMKEYGSLFSAFQWTRYVLV